MAKRTPEKLSIEYWALARVVKSKWKDNFKKHELPSLIKSIEQYGFRDPPAYDKTLKAFVEGNGRVQALHDLKTEGKKPPRGVEFKDDEWWIPVICGVDAKTMRKHEMLQVASIGLKKNSLAWQH